MATTGNKRKKAVAATVAAAAILLAGTFAWTSISQQAKNEAIVDINPGGRLHDDFNGSTKAVYVENFAEEKDGVPIYARIKLTEYMEIGQEAGDKNLADGTRKANVVGSQAGNEQSDQALKAKPETWKVYQPGTDTIASGNAYSEYWTLNWGNTTTDYYYMPTFNKNKDSLTADINGTYDGVTPGDIVHYDDYTKYTADTTPIIKDAVYDWDDNTIDEVVEGGLTETRDETSPRDSASILLKEEKHEVATLDATAEVITMAAWQALSSEEKAEQGYWVYDTDGWAYWSKPIEPGKTTGMFLNSIQMHKVPDDNWYYGLNVIGQFATMADISGFTSKGDSITDDALDLLSEITGIGESFTIEGASKLEPGMSENYKTVMKKAGTVLNAQPENITWTVEELVYGWEPAEDADTEISIATDGKLSVGSDVPPGTTFTVKAAASLTDGRTVSDTQKVSIYVEEADYQQSEKILIVCPAYNTTQDAELLPEKVVNYNDSVQFALYDVEKQKEITGVRWTVEPTYPDTEELLGTSISQSGKLTVTEAERATAVTVYAYVDTGEYAFRKADAYFLINYPTIDITSDFAVGDMRLSPGESVYFEMEEGYFNTAVNWMYEIDEYYAVFEPAEPTFEFFLVGGGSRSLKMEHNCASAAECSCNYYMIVRATSRENPKITGTAGVWVYKGETIDTMHVSIDCVDGCFANDENNGVHDATLVVPDDNRNEYWIAIGEYGVDATKWTLTPGEGVNLGNTKVENGVLHLDLDAKPTNFTLYGVYNKSVDPDEFTYPDDPDRETVTINITVDYSALNSN